MTPEQLGENDRLREFVVALADRVGLDEDQKQAVDIAASMVGVGRLPVVDILDKKGSLSPEEIQRIHDIPKIWADFADQLDFLRVLGVPEIVESYCESWDGAGYPNGIAGDRIPLGARVLAVCYHYNGMISDRPYREAMPHERAAAEIRRMGGRMLDPGLVEAFIEMIEEKRKSARLIAQRTEGIKETPVSVRKNPEAREQAKGAKKAKKRAAKALKRRREKR